MKTTALRMYGANDLRLESFDLPEIKDDEILAKVISDSICMSSYKATIQGAKHKRVPDDVAENPIIIGHEFCGEIVKLGKKLEGKYKIGGKFVVQPSMNYKGSLAAPGYSFPYYGGDATYIIIPGFVIENGFFLPYDGDSFFYGSLAEPMSCIVGGYHANYHHKVQGEYDHAMGITEGGAMAILAGVGPMGLGAIDYAIHCDRKPGKIIVTDINQERINRAKEILPESEGKKYGVDLKYVNTADIDDPVAYLKELSGQDGYNDVFVYAPVKSVVEMGDALLAKDGCLNFFAGPTDSAFSANFNFYNVHYNFTHIVGTTGGNTNDMKEALKLMETGAINPAAMITHIGGLDCAGETTKNLHHIPGGKKLIYTHISLPLTAIADFKELGKTDPLFAELDKICAKHKGLWSGEAEKYLLKNAKALDIK